MIPRSRRRCGVIVASGLGLVVSIQACRRQSARGGTSTLSASPQGTDVATLPARIGAFTSAASVLEGGAQRRTYQQGNTRVTVTLARFPMNPDQYDAWVRTSVDGFPQAKLDVPGDMGNGFYQCTTGAHTSCDLLIQLRSGVHLEIRGGGTCSQADVDTIARGLPLATLAAAGAESHPR